ncbi:MAG: hypothetical protein QW579_07240, partial [Desulfurococcaceae archaeon]
RLLMKGKTTFEDINLENHFMRSSEIIVDILNMNMNGCETCIVAYVVKTKTKILKSTGFSRNRVMIKKNISSIISAKV